MSPAVALRPKLLRVALVEFYGVGGTADYTDCLAQALSRRGHDVTVITSSLFDPLQARPAFKIARPFRYRTSQPKVEKAVLLARSLPAATKLLRHLRPDIIHAQGAVIPAFERHLYGRPSRAAYVCTVHDVEGHEWRPWLGSLPRFYRTFDALVCHSHASRQRLVATLPSARVTVIPHGRYTPLATGRADRRQSRAALGLPGDAHIVLLFGFIRPYKGLEVFLEALRAARDADPSVLGLVAGRPMYDISAIRRRAEHDGLPVRWELRYIPRAETEQFFVAADVVALPYTDTSDSGVVELAAAFGKPVVATNRGGLAEAFSRHGVGALVPSADPGALARAMVRRYVPLPRATASSNSWEAVAVSTESLYRDVMAAGNRGSERRGVA